MVWATVRRAPSREYLELEAQPAPITVNTFMAEIARKIRKPNLNRTAVQGRGYRAHRAVARASAITGKKLKANGLAILGKTRSFENSFKASAIG